MRPYISVSMIVRNEAANLTRLLKELVKFDHIAIVDTGSQDNTIPIIQEFQQKFPDKITLAKALWNDNFAEARNLALSLVQEWIVVDQDHYFIWFDGDDVIDEDFVEKTYHLVEANPEIAAFFLPYWYTIDGNGNPLMIQKRERIFNNPILWEWKGALHEVCILKHRITGGHLQAEEPIVKHEPTTSRYEDKDRNWKILSRELLLHNQRTPDILYYVQRDAGCRGQDEYAIQLGEELLKTDVTGFMRYECHKHIADAYARIYKKTGVQEYYNAAIAHYSAGIEPGHNEAIAGAIELFLYAKEYNQIPYWCESLNENPPATTNAVTIDKYGGYKHAITSILELRNENIASAIASHLKATNNANVSELSCEVEQAIRAIMESRDIGIIYVEDPTDEEYREAATSIKDQLIEYEVFKEVVISDDPTCVHLSRRVYIHIGDNPDNFHKDEAHPHVEKYLLTKVAMYEDMFGYVDTSDLQNFPLATYVPDIVLGNYGEFYCETIEEGLAHAKTCPAKYVSIVFDPACAVTASKELCMHLHPHRDTLLCIRGKTEDVIKLAAQDNHIWFGGQSPELLSDPMHLGGIIEWTATLENDTPEETVCIIAGGMEEWDGTTPYKYGIGGSESSVVYLGEQLAKQGFRVIVYSPTTAFQTIGLVEYRPLTSFNAGSSEYDYFISSRLPHVLNRRIGRKKQYLWLHDLIETYQGLDEIIADNIIVVSDHELEKAKAMYAEGKLGAYPIVMSNAINPHTPTALKLHNSFVWTSSPDRGLDTFIEVMKRLHKPDWSVTYSWANMNVAYATNPKMYKQIAEQKYKVRSNGGKIIGRLGILELKQLMDQTQWWIYPSTFEETFCISAVEAVNSQCKIIANSNGAVKETLTKTGAGKDVWGMFNVTDKFTSNDVNTIVKLIHNWNHTNENTEVAKELTWNCRGNLWKELLKAHN